MVGHKMIDINHRYLIFGFETNGVFSIYGISKVKPIQNIDHMFNAAKYNIQNTKA